MLIPISHNRTEQFNKRTILCHSRIIATTTGAGDKTNPSIDCRTLVLPKQFYAMYTETSKTTSAIVSTTASVFFSLLKKN